VVLGLEEVLVLLDASSLQISGDLNSHYVIIDKWLFSYILDLRAAASHKDRHERGSHPTHLMAFSESASKGPHHG
jgi:hypothetical protein